MQKRKPRNAKMSLTFRPKVDHFFKAFGRNVEVHEILIFFTGSDDRSWAFMFVTE